MSDRVCRPEQLRVELCAVLTDFLLVQTRVVQRKMRLIQTGCIRIKIDIRVRHVPRCTYRLPSSSQVHTTRTEKLDKSLKGIDGWIESRAGTSPLDAYQVNERLV
jgi:hypothetical protein